MKALRDRTLGFWVLAILLVLIVPASSVLVHAEEDLKARARAFMEQRGGSDGIPWGARQKALDRINQAVEDGRISRPEAKTLTHTWTTIGPHPLIGEEGFHFTGREKVPEKVKGARHCFAELFQSGRSGRSPWIRAE